MIKKYIRLALVLSTLITNIPQSLSFQKKHINDITDTDQKHERKLNSSIEDSIYIISNKILQMGISKNVVNDGVFWDKIRDNIIVAAKALDSFTGEKFSDIIFDRVRDYIKHNTDDYHPTYNRYQNLHRKVISSNLSSKVTQKSKYENYNAVETRSSRIIQKLNDKEDLIRNITDGLLYTIDKTKELNLESKEKQEYDSSIIKSVDIINSNLIKKVIEEQQIKANRSKLLTRRNFDSTSLECDCDCIINYFCTEVRTLNVFKCLKDKSTTDLVNVCDTKEDCPDWSDEIFCTDIVKTRIKRSNDYVQDLLYLVNNCNSTKHLENKLIEALNSILSIQTKYLENFQYSRRMNRDLNKSQALNQAARLIKQLGLVLDVTVCVNILSLNDTTIDPEILTELQFLNASYDESVIYDQAEGLIVRRSMPSADKLSNETSSKDVTVPKINELWFPANCACYKGVCAKECVPRCQYICERQYYLGRVNCHGNDKKISVPIHQLCDGIIDCIDGSDERCDRSLTEYNVKPLYDDILYILENKLMTKKYSDYAQKFQEFYEEIRMFNKLIDKGIRDKRFASLRNDIFSEIPLLYEEVVKHAKNLDDEKEIYFYLNFINDKLILALKKIRNGNNIRDLTSRQCVCVNDKCALHKCDIACNRTCNLTDQLMKFSCNKAQKDAFNNYVSISAICDGKKDCSNGFDEKHCLKERCQKNHLFYIKHDLQDIIMRDEKEATSSLGIMLELWKLKTVKNIENLSSLMKPSHKLLRNIVNTSIKDLASTYVTAMNETRRINKYNLEKLISISQVLINQLKKCDL